MEGEEPLGWQLLLLTNNVVSLEAFVVVWVIVFSFLFVVAACTLTARFATAHPIFGVGKVGLLVVVGVRLEFIRIGALEVGVLMWLQVGLVVRDTVGFRDIETGR